MRQIILATVVLIGLSSPVLSASPAGEAVKIDPLAELVTRGEGSPLKVKQPVYSGDTVRTGLTGEAQIVFRDQTRLVVGPGASLKIDQFVAGGGNKARKFAIKALAGAYRFISGKSGRKAYSIHTPTAIVGIRGTAFDFNVGHQGRTLVMLHRGAVRVCSTSGGCRLLDDPCEIAQTRRGAPAARSEDPGFLVRRNELARSFPYVRSQRSLRDDFRIAGVHRCRAAVAGSALGGGDGHGSGDQGSGGQF